MEYVAVRILVRNISTTDESTMIGGSYCKTTGSASVLYDLPSVVEPDPALDATLFPGGEDEGWVVLQAAKDTKSAMRTVLISDSFSRKLVDSCYSLQQSSREVARI